MGYWPSGSPEEAIENEILGGQRPRTRCVPCGSAVRFLALYDDPNRAWQACPHSEWLIWWLLGCDYFRHTSSPNQWANELWSVDRIRAVLPNFPL
jgi:hypothetical protein